MKSSIDYRIALRSILKNKVQSLVSVIGLGIGLGAIILLTMLYMHENSFDKHIPDNSEVFRILHGDNSKVPFPLAETVANEIPSIENFFRYYQSGEFEVKLNGNDIVKEERFVSADQSVFDMLGISMLVGKAAESINEVAISEKMAYKYFANGNALNKPIEVRLSNDFVNLNVCGVYKDIPSNSTLTPNFISHTNIIAEFIGNRRKLFGEYGADTESFKTNWNRGICLTYIKINSNSDQLEVTNQLQKYLERFEDTKKRDKTFRLQAVTDIYLQSGNISDTFSQRGNASEMKYFVAIAFFILIIAAVNYIFLTKVKMENRLKELGVKRVLGASTSTIRKQLLLEANLISFFSLVPAIVVVIVGMPFINITLGRTLDSQILSTWYALPLLLLIPLSTGTFSGFIVGLKTSRISAILLLNKKTSVLPIKNQWSNSILILHFSVFMVLVVGVMTLSKQINYALNNFTAINPKNVIICELNTPKLSQKFDVISDQVKQMPGVKSTAGSSFIPPFNWTIPIRLRDPQTKETIVFDGLIMGKGMTELLGIEIIDGNHFGNYNANQRGFIFNESAALKYNLKAGETFNGFHIQGIAKDFTAHTMHSHIKPMAIIQQHPNKMRLFAIKTTGETDEQIKASISKLFKDISPDKMVSIYTLQEQIGQFYNREQDQAKLISAFSILAVVLSIMGLLGLVMNTISRKTKEIGVRKVNGATISEILTMINIDLLKWVVIAFIFAAPIAYYTMNKWLENFAYKTTLSWWIFALTAVLALGIAILTVSWKSWKAARQNPVEALRYE